MRRGVCALLVLLCCGALAACGQPGLPQPSARPTSEVVPVLTSSQLDAVITRVVDGVAAADASKDPAALAQFADGPALSGRTAAYTMLAKNPSLNVLRPIGDERLQDVIPLDGQWPRSLLTVTRRDDTDTLPMLLVLTQRSPREQYKLTASVPMVSGATLPRTAAVRDGVNTRRMGDRDGLTLAPREAADLYAAILTQGTGVPRADLFGPSPLTDAVLKQENDTRTLLTVTCPNCFTVSIDNRATGRLWTFGTLDEGALVIAEISQDTVIESKNGFTTDLGPEVQALAGISRITSKSTQSQQIVVALNIPPAESQTPATVVAGSSALVAATAS